MLYKDLPLRERLNFTITTVDECKINKARNKAERDKKDKMMVDKLSALHGPLPEGDWRAWNICGCAARQKGSTDYCVKHEHWFLYNSDCQDEKKQLRELKDEGLIKDLPTGQKRYRTNKKNGSHNFQQKDKCPGCNKKIMSVNLERHMNSCDDYKELMDIEQKHKNILQKTGEADLNSIIMTLVNKSISEFLGKSFKNRDEYVNKYKDLYLTMVENKLNDTKSTIEITKQQLKDKDTQLKHLQKNNENLIKRLKQYEDAMKLIRAFGDAS